MLQSEIPQDILNVLKALQTDPDEFPIVEVSHIDVLCSCSRVHEFTEYICRPKDNTCGSLDWQCKHCHSKASQKFKNIYGLKVPNTVTSCSNNIPETRIAVLIKDLKYNG